MRRLALAVGESDSGERLDRFIASQGGISRGRARRVLEVGGVFLDGRRCKVAGRLVRAGQQVVVNLEEGGREARLPLPLDRTRLLFADSEIAAVDKPAGVPAQATLTGDRGALPELVSALLGAPVTLVHRLDRETSGVTVFARTRTAAAALAEAFRLGRPEKVYLALCTRAPEPPSGRIDLPLGKDPLRSGRRCVTTGGEPAATVYRVLSWNARAALVEARPETGRTHQIRVHLAHLGAPLLGDPRYGGPRMVGTVSVPRVMLHAQRLSLVHPATGASLTFEAPVPVDFRSVQDALLS